MKICLLSEGYHQYRGGIESFTHMLAHSLIAQGHQVHIITTTGEEKFYLQDASLQEKGLYIHKVTLKQQPFFGFWKINKILPLYEIYFSYCITKKLNEIIRGHKIDIFESSIINLWYFKKRIPFVIRLHGYAGFEERYSHDGSLRNFLRVTIKWWIEKKLLENADALISVSRDHVKAASKLWKLKHASDMHIIHNGIDATLFSPVRDSGSRNNDILFVGRIHKGKGVGVLVDVIPEVLKDFPETQFIFVGKDSTDEYGNSYTAQLTYKTQNKRISFLGALSQEEVIGFYRKTSVCVFPSLFREPFPMVMLEAMACGCAVIASDKGGFTEVIQDGANGLLVPQGDAGLLALAIKKLLGNSKLTDDLSRNAIKEIRSNFTINHTTEKTLAVYQTVLDKP